MNVRDKAREKARISKSNDDWAAYKILRNRCTRLQSIEKKKSELDSFNDIMEKNDTKRLFTKTRKMLNWKSGGPPRRFLLDGNIFQKAEEIANLQMDYFVKKIIRIGSSLETTGQDPLRLL